MHPRNMYPEDQAVIRKACQFGLFVFGMIAIVMAIPNVVAENRLFLQGRHQGMSEDLQSFQNLSREEFTRKYGDDERAVAIYFGREEPEPLAVFVPSEDYAVVNLVVCVVAARHSNGPSLYALWAYMLLVIYLPLALSIGYVASFLARNLCWSERADNARREFVADRQFRWHAFLLSTCCTLVLALLGAWIAWQPAFRAYGVTFFDLTAALVFLAYFGGLYLLIFRQLVDVIFLAAGLNPLRYIWDEFLVLLFAVPVLLLVYQNSWLTIAMTIAGGLGTGLIAKWELARQRRKLARPRPVPSTSLLTA